MFDFAAARHAMTESQIRTSDVTDLALLKAFRSTPRENFVPKSQQALAYADAHVTTSEGRVMVRPRDFAKLVHALDVQPSDIVLDVACGRGYSTAILAGIADTVVGLDSSEESVSRATDNLTGAEVTNAAVVQGDLTNGAKAHGPFDVILVNGAVETVPQGWLDQLADGGRLGVVVLEGGVGRATVFTRSGDSVGDRVVFDSNVPALPEYAAEPEFAL